MAILETTPEFIRMYPLAEVNIRVGEILSQAEHEFLRTE
jgi:hypothetical protein